jgi:NarL family two-component system response regulator YdfI
VTRVFVLSADRATRAALEVRVRNAGLQLAGSGEAIAEGDRSDPDVLVLDGLNEALPTQAAGDSLPIVVLTDAIRQVAQRLGRLGLPAWGVLPRGITAADLGAAVEAVARGLVVVPPSAAQVGDGATTIRHDVDFEESDEHLTSRELEVLELASQGLSNREIAISDHTVKFHLGSIYSKLGASTRTQAVKRGLRRGLITL